MRLIDADALIEALHIEWDEVCVWDESGEATANEVERLIKEQPTIKATPKEVPRRVLWTGWKGYRDTRYRCPNCEKPVKNDDVYCHRCGQRLMFPKIDFTPYVKGQKQELIVRWDDETD